MAARVVALARATTISRVEVGVLVLCVVLAAVSLLFPSTPTYDPWSWLVWGRQIVHGSLDTVEGPSWKPLPIFFTIPFSFFHGYAPDLWLVVARASAMASVVAAYALVRRLVPGRAGIFGGLFAAISLLYSLDYVRTVALGQSEGMLVLVLLLGVDRHMRGLNRQAMFAGFLAGLLRPEVWPMLALYGLWLIWHDRGTWRYVVGLGVATIALWVGPEEWGSGNLLRAAERANDPTSPDALAFAAHPFNAVLDLAHRVVSVPVLVGLGLAIGLGILAVVRGQRRGVEVVMLALGLWALLWVLGVAIETDNGFSGNPRYLMPPTGLGCVVAGLGWAVLVREAARRLPRWAPVALGAVVVAGFAASENVALGFPALRSNLEYQARLRDSVPAAIAAAGGRDKVISCALIATNRYQVPMLSWYLRVPGAYLKGYWLPQGYMFQARPNGPTDQPDPIPGPDNHFVAEVGPWSIFNGQCWRDLPNAS